MLSVQTHKPEEPVARKLSAIDVAQKSRHEGAVGGQPAWQPQGGRALQDPVPAFADPVLALESPAALASDAQVLSLSGEDLSVAAPGDVHLAATHTD